MFILVFFGESLDKPVGPVYSESTIRIMQLEKLYQKNEGSDSTCAITARNKSMNEYPKYRFFQAFHLMKVGNCLQTYKHQ